MNNTEFMQIYVDINSQYLTEANKQFLLEEAKTQDFFETLEEPAKPEN